MKNKALLLDRDGILNKPIIREGKPFPPSKIEECELTDGIEKVLQEFKESNYKLIVITNQPDIARGKTNLKTVEKINNYIKGALNIDAFYICPHDDKDNCNCRKPKPGLILKAAKDYNLDLSSCFFIGDRWKDINAGNSAKVKTIFLDYGYNEDLKSNPTYIVKRINDIPHIIKENTKET